VADSMRDYLEQRERTLEARVSELEAVVLRIAALEGQEEAVLLARAALFECDQSRPR
jgi:hypothetical protein